MQIICGINKTVQFRAHHGHFELKNVPVKNATITETIMPEQVKALLSSCADADEFQQRAFHVVSRKWKKEGVVVFPAEFRGLKEYWESQH